MDNKRITTQRELYWDEYQRLVSLRGNRHDVKPAYQLLVEQKDILPKELYGALLREMLQYSIEGVPKDQIIKAFDGVSRENVMYDDEIEAMKNWDNHIRIYRGASIAENDPKTSWSLRKSVAEEYSKGVVLTAVVPKDAILLYFAHDVAEDEVVVNVQPGQYEILGC